MSDRREQTWSTKGCVNCQQGYGDWISVYGLDYSDMKYGERETMQGRLQPSEIKTESWGRSKKCQTEKEVSNVEGEKEDPNKGRTIFECQNLFRKY